MKTLSYAKIVILTFLLIGLTSCGDEYYTDDYLKNSNEKLCSKEWIDEYVTIDDRLIQHELIFRTDGRGTETIRTWWRLPNGNWNADYSVIRDPFLWSWSDRSMERLVIDFYQEEILYFDNVWIREHYLSGKLDGVEVTFTDSSLLK